MALAATITLVALAGCGQSQPAAPGRTPPSVRVMTLHASAVPVSVELPGRTAPFLVAQVRARVDGIVQKRGFQVGADVRAGQSLYQIDPAPYRSALQSAEAALQKAEANLAALRLQAQRYAVLVGDNAVSQQTYDNAVAARSQAEADVSSAQAALANARINLGYTEVRAPISGRSSGSLVTQGAYVQGSAATLLTTVQQIDPMYVDLSQSSTAGLPLRQAGASGQLRPADLNGAPVTLTLEDGTPYALPGKVQYQGITVDQTTGAVTLRAVFPNPKGVLLPGMFVRARVQQGVRDHAFRVPVSAVTHNARGEAVVMAVDEAGKAAQRLIQTGAIEGADWVVTQGLKDGERVIVAGWQKVQPGMAVAATEASAANASSPQ
jgi:membrane fusion protein (multidrug efflux system)